MPPQTKPAALPDSIPGPRAALPGAGKGAAPGHLTNTGVIDTAEWLQRHDYRPSTFERIAEALGSRDFFIFYCGVFVGCLLTCGLALLWSFAS